MTRSASSAGSFPPEAAVSLSVIAQLAHLARRSILRTLRQPVRVLFPLVFPLAVMAVNVGGLEDTVEIPGFPADSVLDFLLALAFIQGALFAAIGAGTDIAQDIETGFFDRLSLTPVRPEALLLGEMTGALMMGFVQAVVYLSAAGIAGATVKAGTGGVIVLIMLSVLLALVFATVGALLALKTGSGEAVQGLFPLLFVAVLISSAIMPRNLIETGWFKVAATYNPMSYLIEGVRSVIIAGWDAEALALCLGLALGITSVGLSISAFGLRTRMGRA